MAVMQNSIIFGGINSADFGIYIGGEGVFNAPKRAVEMVTVPGRNGDIAIDQGHYENIEVTYSAFNYEEDLATFAKNLSDFRNAIVSQVGYQRLTDTFHPDEYRMAIYTEGLEIDPIKYNTASEFELKFNCKPQRWLANGATAITVSDGDTLINPTQYDAGPLLAVKGHGDVSFNGYTVAIDAGEYGVINVKGKQTSTNPITYATDASLYNDGDTIYVFVECDWVLTTLRNIYARSYSNQHDTGAGQTVMEPRSTSGNNRAVGTTIINSSFLSSQDETLTNTFSFDSLLSNGTTVTVSVIVEVTWDATNKTLSVSSSVPHASGWGGSHRTFPTITIEAASTKTYLGDPTLVDCELGEAYKVEDGEIISLNKYIELGSDLPKLSPGANDVTTDNTITELKVTPNWWKL